MRERFYCKKTLLFNRHVSFLFVLLVLVEVLGPHSGVATASNKSSTVVSICVIQQDTGYTRGHLHLHRMRRTVAFAPLRAVGGRPGRSCILSY